ncbi:DoxX family protein [Hymenobacter sp. BT188]|uniref:DoxX family protein n=1 Tax=Hymenobacter sp. BT188 TaxID=2763504 RepID=UPI001650FD32|nr:DoxX family protein [Hymenobacter sp. BT188]MBC6607692.1 DoxX family protein [Hymenobacter sp. BT188]
MKKLLFSATPLGSRFADIAWLLLRLHIGLSIAIGAGWAKLVSMTTATEAAKLAGEASALAPPDWFVQQVANLGFTFPSPYMWAWLACWGEFAGGLLIAFGLFTRLGAFQLAFQFFVIAFLWYENPEFIVGMNYQQLLFWCFILVTVVGGGRYSLDYMLTRNTNWLRRFVPTRQVASAGAAVLTLFLATTSWAGGSLNSDLLIEPGKQFALGGGQPGAFRVVARNTGKVPVEIKERPRGGGIVGKATLAPGQRATLHFLPGSTALLLNPSSDQKARLDLRVTGDTNLSMGYEVNGKQ